LNFIKEILFNIFDSIEFSRVSLIINRSFLKLVEKVKKIEFKFFIILLFKSFSLYKRTS
jgi:hypothetical protein